MSESPAYLPATFRVAGRSRSKGSLKPINVRGQRPRLVEDHPHSKPWRTRIVNAVRLAVPAVNLVGHVPYGGPVAVEALFQFERLGPTAQALAYPMVNSGVNANGDLDKLVRNLLDALTDSRLIADDCQVVSLDTSKVWAIPGVTPGVYVTVAAL